MRKIFLIILGTLAIVLLFSGLIKALEKPISQDEIIEKQLDNLNLHQLERELKKISKEMGDTGLLPSIPEFIKGFSKGELPLNFKVLLNKLLESFFKEIRVNVKLLGQLLVLAIISSLLQVMRSSFNSEGIAQLTQSIVYLVLILLLIGSLQSALGYGRDTIKSMVDFMMALVPLLMALLLGVGAVTSAAVFQPVVFLGITYMSNLLSNVVLPMIFFSALLALVNGISKDFRITKLVALIKEISVALLGVVLVLFSGLLALQGTAVAVGDGLTIRTAKYLTGALVPVFGSMFADALELVAGCSLLIKNGLGILGLLGIIIITIFPIIKICAIIFIYKVVAALIEPLGEEGLAKVLNDTSNIIVLLFLTVLAASVMSFVCLTMVVGIANIVVMLR